MAESPDAKTDDVGGSRDAVRRAIVAAATELLASNGPDGLTTRAVAAAAGVQAPTIYRLFGDKRGLVEAVAEHGLATYLAEKEVREFGPDPVADLRAGWDLHVGFGLANPDAYSLMHGGPGPGVPLPAVAAAVRILQDLIRSIAASGQLRVSEELAADLVQACGRGTVLTLLARPEDRRDPRLSDAAREAMIAAITTESPALDGPSPAVAAITLRALLPDVVTLTDAERSLLEEWLDRLAASGDMPAQEAPSPPGRRGRRQLLGAAKPLDQTRPLR